MLLIFIIILKTEKNLKKDIEKNGCLEDYEIKLKSKDSKILNCLLSTSIIKNPFDEIIGYQGVIKNITLEKEYQELLKKQLKRKNKKLL